MEDAEAVAASGAFAMVLEGTVEPLGRAVTERVPIPVVGIGASPACDGQILVIDDVIGMFTDFTPKFVKRYAEVGQQVEKAAEAYAADVRARRFPGPEHLFGVRPKAPCFRSMKPQICLPPPSGSRESVGVVMQKLS